MLNIVAAIIGGMVTKVICDAYGCGTCGAIAAFFGYKSIHFMLKLMGADPCFNWAVIYFCAVLILFHDTFSPRPWTNAPFLNFVGREWKHFLGLNSDSKARIVHFTNKNNHFYWSLIVIDQNNIICTMFYFVFSSISSFQIR